MDKGEGKWSCKGKWSGLRYGMGNKLKKVYPVRGAVTLAQKDIKNRKINCAFFVTSPQKISVGSRNMTLFCWKVLRECLMIGSILHNIKAYCLAYQMYF